MAVAAQRHTHATMTDLLRQRYSGQAGNGREWAFCADVRNAAGFNASRTMDALAMALWPSRGLALHGHEIKCSRRDWVRELGMPEKADVWHGVVDYWWLVAADDSVVQAGELPDGWGLMVANDRGLRVQVQAQQYVPEDPSELRGRYRPVGRSFLAALLRSMQREGDIPPEEVQAAVLAERERMETKHARDTELLQERLATLRAMRRTFEAASGVQMRVQGEDYNFRADAHTPEEVGAALRVVLAGGTRERQLREAFGRLADQADRLAAQAREAAGQNTEQEEVRDG